MSKVLIVGSEQKLRDDLCGTVLLSKHIVREWIDDIGRAGERIPCFKPHLIVIEWPEEKALFQMISSLRQQGSRKQAGIVVISRTLAAETEKKLINAGANLILPVPAQPELWNSYLKQLLNVTPRFNTRVGVTFALWSINLSEDRSECRALCLNLSMGGMLIQTCKELHAGSKLDLRFRPPGQENEINVLGQIMWSMPDSEGAIRSGIQFIIMRNDARKRIAAFIDSVLPAQWPGAHAPGLRAQDETAEWERELRISEARKMAILDAANDAVISVDATGHILEFNAAAEAMFGLRRAEVLCKLLIETVVPESHKEALHRKFRWLVTDKKNLLETLRSTSAGLRRDGTEFPAEISMKSMIVKGRLVFTFFIQDISALQQARQERRELEVQLLQSQKLEALGTLAGGIAHDFNNILTAIMGYTELSRMAASHNESLRNYLDNVMLSTNRARDLVKQLLAFSRKGMDRYEPVKVSASIREVIKLLRASLPATIDIRQHIGDESCMINSNPTRIHQVLMNLCTNAAHAINDGGGGRINISLDCVDLDDGQAEAHAGLQPGPYARITVRDTGAGIAPDVLPRIFEPFFTTKGGQGSGMGLSVAHGIITSHGGDITVESQPGAGSAFHVLLPRITAEEIMQPSMENFLQTGTERILIVDDEQALVDLWRMQFELLGYRVVALSSSLNALSEFQRNPDAYDLVITDMTMPGMTGDILAGEIRKLRPEMPVIICSGFCEQLTEKRVKELGLSAVVMKPMHIAEIIRIIRGIFD